MSTLCLAVLLVEAVSYLLLTLSQNGGKDSPATRGELTPAPQDPGLAAKRERIQTQQVLHPFLGYVQGPDHPTSQQARRSPQAVEFGFPRNNERLFYGAAEDRLVVGLFGGSVASILANVGARALERGLSKIEDYRGRQIVVVGFAQGGYKQPQQLMTLNYFLALGAHLDIAINLDGFNDVALAPAESLRQGVFPFYPQHWALRVEKARGEIWRMAGELTYLRAEVDRRSSALAESPLRLSPTVRLWRRFEHRRLQAAISKLELALLNTQRSAGASYQALGPQRRYASQDELYRDLVEVWQRSSRQMHALCRGLGIEYYHFLQPNQYVEGSKTLTREERERAWNENQPYRPGVERGYPLLAAAGRELARQGVPFRDLTMVFSGVGETVYHDPCCHYNRRGNVILAGAMAKAIAELRKSKP